VRRDKRANRLKSKVIQKAPIKGRAKRPPAIRPGGAIGLLSRPGPGSLFSRRAQRLKGEARGGDPGQPSISGDGASRGRHWMAFAGVYLFTMMLYARPNDLFPALSDFPLVKILAIGVLAIYVLSKGIAGDKLSVWTLEMTMLVTI